MFTMELPAKALAQSLRTVSSVCRLNSIPILTNALIKIADGRASICATDLDQWVTAEIECEGSGELTIDAARLEAISVTLDAGALKIKANGSGVAEISQGRAHFSLPTLPVEDFPVLPKDVSAHQWTFDAETFAAMLRALEPAVERGKRRYLNGIHFDIENGRVVATDGRMLGQMDLTGLKKKSVKAFTVPHESLAVIYGLCKGSKEIALSLPNDGNSATFTAGQISFRTKLLEDSFPDYVRVVPKSGAVTGTVHCADIMRAVACASLIGENRNGCRLGVSFGEDELTISSRDGDGRIASDVCEWDRKSGSNIVGAWNAPYLRWAVSSLGEAATLHLEIEDAGSAIVIRADGDTARTSIRVAMPMR